ncbi:MULTISPECIES: hypothetical protein [Bacillus]|jgi:hypothetical protein|nr:MULTISPECIES: hypothetical protein [Bacillus]MEC5240230.1 hypothetical protein [Bacillus mycoides]MEC5265920.1 hypothetical protein [Bacillus mycoides]WOA55660.1 hypothetical protein RVY74_16545 [Bacillus mycoides]
MNANHRDADEEGKKTNQPIRIKKHPKFYGSYYFFVLLNRKILKIIQKKV